MGLVVTLRTGDRLTWGEDCILEVTQAMPGRVRLHLVGLDGRHVQRVPRRRQAAEESDRPAEASHDDGTG